MTVTTSRSAFPPALVELLPRARELADQLGEVPSRNRLKKELRVGAPKATALRDALLADGPAPRAESVPEPELVMPPDEPEAHVPDPVSLSPAEPEPDEPAPVAAVLTVDPLPIVVADPGTDTAESAVAAAPRPVRSWPVLLLALPAFVAIWSGWVGLGELSGFGIVHPLPGIWDQAQINTAITLPIGVETYAAYALNVWLSSGAAGRKARRFAKWSAIGSLLLGMAGQGAYHLMTAYEMARAPWPIVTLVACLPVAVLGMGAALAHLVRNDADER